MIGADRPAILGGAPASLTPLHIVRPSFPPLERFAGSFAQALETGVVTNHGPAVRAFEQALTAYLGVSTIATSSGQAALMLMLRAAGIDGGEVICPAFTFSATPHAVRWCGAEPIFADIAADGSLGLCPKDCARRITPRTRAILGVDVYGIAPDYDALEALGREHGLKVLFDSAPAFGTRIAGRPIGGRGDAQSFSFHATKAFTTMEGGALATRDADLLTRAAALRNFGQDASGPDCAEPGLNGKMQEVCALIGLQQLATFEQAAAHRRAIARRYRLGLHDVPGLGFATIPRAQDPIWLYFPLFVEREVFGLDRDELVAALQAENLFVRKYFELPCHHLTAFASQRSVRLPRAEHAARSVVALPVYNDMMDAECDAFSSAVRRIQRHAAAVRATLAGDGVNKLSVLP